MNEFDWGVFILIMAGGAIVFVLGLITGLLIGL